jgi:hypothetical protein
MTRTSTVAFAILAIGCTALGACNRPSKSREGRNAASSSVVASISPSGELPKCQPVACTPAGPASSAGGAPADEAGAAYPTDTAAAAGGYAARARYAGGGQDRAHTSRAGHRHGSSIHARRYAANYGGARYASTGGRTAHYGYLDEPLDRGAYDDRYAKAVHMTGYSRGWSDRHEWTPSTGVYDEHRAWGPHRQVYVERHGVPPVARGRYEGHSLAAAGGYYEKRGYGPATSLRVERRAYGLRGCPPGAWLDRWGRCASGSNEVRLDNGFFYDSGGVGPAFVSSGGGGGFVVVGSSSRASASASAFARARAHVSVHGRFHGGGKGCGGCGGHKGGHGGH